MKDAWVKKYIYDIVEYLRKYRIIVQFVRTRLVVGVFCIQVLRITGTEFLVRYVYEYSALLTGITGSPRLWILVFDQSARIFYFFFFPNVVCYSIIGAKRAIHGSQSAIVCNV